MFGIVEDFWYGKGKCWRPWCQNSRFLFDSLIWYDMIWYDMIWYDMIYLSTAVGLTPGGTGTAHIYTQTIHRTTQIQTIHRTTQITTNLEKCGPCPIFASFTLAFALQLRKKHGKPSVRVVSNTRNYVSEEFAVSFFRVEHHCPLMSMLHPRLSSLSETKFDTREHWSVKLWIFKLSRKWCRLWCCSH